MSFPRYPSYKDSGVEWLGDVPEHWEVIRLKNALQCRITDGPHTTPVFVDEGVPFLSVDGIQDGELKFDGCRFISETDHEEYRRKARPQKDDLLMGKAASTGKIARVKVDFEFSIWSPLALIRLDPKVSNPVFYEQSLKSPIVQAQIDNLCTSNTQKNISMDDIPKLILTSPPLPEQTQIAAFLDRETAKIDELVAEQRRLMELLKEKRQAVISHAVTKGLNPDAPMKPSGIEWLGDVPAHWRVMTLGRVTVSRCDGPFGSGLKSEHYTDSGVRVIRLQNIRRDGFNGSDEAFIDPGYYASELSGHDVVSGDVLIAGLGDDRNTVGRACVAPVGIEPAMVKADCFRYRLDTAQALPEFIATQLSASSAADAGMMSSGTTRSRIPLSVMATRKLTIPPVSEQREIAEFIRTKASKFDTLTAEAHRAIDILQERRTALISAAVTGQIDVRAAL